MGDAAPPKGDTKLTGIPPSTLPRSQRSGFPYGDRRMANWPCRSSLRSTSEAQYQSKMREMFGPDPLITHVNSHVAPPVVQTIVP